MRISVRAALAACAVAAAALATVAPAGAQEGPASLGFQVDKTEGAPGDEVNGQVDVADVAENCTTDVAAFQARFQELFTGAFNNGANSGELFDMFFPGGDFEFTNHDQTAYVLTGFVTIGVGGDPSIAEGALPQTFVMTFADIATQEPVGDRANFDPATGEGFVVVPDVDPGQWAVAATCVGPTSDIDQLAAGIRESGDFLEEIGAPLDLNSPEFGEFAKEYTGNPDATIIDFLTQIGPRLLEPIMVPDALGFQIFCVQDAEGRCPGEEPPPTTAPPTTAPTTAPPTTEPPANEQPVAQPAQPVRAEPNFTG